MTEEEIAARASSDEAVLQQQYLRSLSSFEGIVLSQIDLKNRLGDRLNYSIRAGLIILGVIALSILVLLLTLSAQVTKMSAVVEEMNLHFTSVSEHMELITAHMHSMEGQAGHLPTMEEHLVKITADMDTIRGNMHDIGTLVRGMRGEFDLVRDDIQDVDLTMGQMNMQVRSMGADIHHMAAPARTMNRFIPIP